MADPDKDKDKSQPPPPPQKPKGDPELYCPPEAQEALAEVVSIIGAKLKDFDGLVQFESRWDPKARNKSSDANGVIQFMPSTAFDLGYYMTPDQQREEFGDPPMRLDKKSGQMVPGSWPGWKGASRALVARHEDITEQLRGPVLAYFSQPHLKQRWPLNTMQKVCMAVFYPAAITWPEDAEFPDQVQAQNPGIRLVRDYVEHVRKRVARKG